MSITKVFVIGSGTMGNGLVQNCLTAGFDVTLRSRSVDQEKIDKLTAKFEKAFNKAIEKGKMTEDEKKTYLSNFKMTSKLEDAADADLVIEASAEDINIKLDIFKTLDEVCKPETILATNTSSLSVTEIAACTNRPNQIIGMHFFNPVPSMKLLEIVVAQQTDDATYDTAIDVGEKMGKVNIKTQDKAGFIVNRLMAPMINEAVLCLEEGVATAEDIDNGCKYGLNHPMGALALADLIGLDVMVAIMDVLYFEFQDSKYRCAPLMRRMVRAGNLGRKSGKGFYDYNK
jgi:3-hydroxybutyryl-CoA dehydrogenase